jgi:hypothetical protein
MTLGHGPHWKSWLVNHLEPFHDQLRSWISNQSNNPVLSVRRPGLLTAEDGFWAVKPTPRLCHSTAMRVAPMTRPDSFGLTATQGPSPRSVWLHHHRSSQTQGRREARSPYTDLGELDQARKD